MLRTAKGIGFVPLLMGALLSLILAETVAGGTRTIEFVARDFRTQHDNPSDFRSIGDPFGIFGLPPPLAITGSMVFDPDAHPLFGPATSDAGDLEFENSSVHRPYDSFTVVLGPEVVLSGVQGNFADAIVIGDGVGTKTNDNLWFQSLTNQQVQSGIVLDSMQIQLIGERASFARLDVPSVDVYNTMTQSMPSHDEKLRIDLFDAQGNPHKLVAFDIKFFEVREIAIDIKPGSDPNCFNVNGHGVVPVAILGADDFDATQVDLFTLSFAGLGLRVRGKGPACSVSYLNSDVYLDLICHFEDDTDMWKPGNGEATLAGVLHDGTRFRGFDSICSVP